MTWDRTREVLDRAVRDRIFPGASLEVGTGREVMATLSVGTLSYEPASHAVGANTVYDLASLTKVLCTTTLVATLADARAMALDDPVHAWVPAWAGVDRRAVTIRDLLEHASGLPAHRPYFEHLHGREAFEDAIAREPLEYEPRARSVYSDAGFILLGLVIERAGGATLDQQFDRWRAAHLDSDIALRFWPPASWRVRIAPTEADPWRGRMLVGEVHDENAWALGGVAGHAGLFGTASAVGSCARWWMRARATSAAIAAFTRRGNVPGSSRALGWDTMRPTSSCGTRMHPSAFGHTGFTGTSIWIDPEQDRYVVCVSNRVHPTREGDGISGVRQALHDAVASDLDRV